MARQVIDRILSDLSGEEANATLKFAVNGADFEIDLTDDEVATFNDAIEGFVEKARRVRANGKPGRGARVFAKPPKATPSNGNGHAEVDNATVRAWAADQGVTLANRGRIPASVISAYLAGNAPTPSITPAFVAPAEPEPDAPKRGVKSKMPSADEVLGAYEQAGSFKALGDHFGVSSQTARVWVAKAQAGA
jgi:hypothetical protein